MFKQKRIVAMLLSMVMVFSMFMGNTNWSMVTDVFAADAAPTNLTIKYEDDNFTITWDSNGATSYDIYRATSRYGVYEKIDTVEDVTTYTDDNPNAVKYENYYKVAEINTEILSEPISLEMDMFGDGMYIFSPNDDIEQVYTAFNDVYEIQAAVDDTGTATDGGQFSSGRYAMAFKPGDYSNMEAWHFNISYYMQVLGLGELPTMTTIRNLHVPPVLPDSNVTCNFWMGLENISISPYEDVDGATTDAWFQLNWSVSQAAPARRLYVQRGMNLNYVWDGWASGGYVADSIVEGYIGSWTQQQYYLRNNNVKGDLHGINWNLVTQGCVGFNGDNWTNTQNNYPFYDLESGLGKTNWKSGGKYTMLDKTDAIREKPFLYYDTEENEYKVFAPAMRRNAKGTSWSEYGNGSGTTYDISDFYIARADRDNAASINAALDAGKNIILSPGIYYAEEPINIKRANTIVLGLGLATIIPTNTETGIKIADVDGVTLAGVILDADSYSENMLVVGEAGSNKDHASDPTIIQDVFIRIGGVHGGVASTESAMVINSNDVIGDHFWIWRADHGAGVGWDLNKAKNGLVVNGNDVTLYGLMVEHFQEYDVLWKGENGKNYFLQNEKAYDPQNQADWMSHNGTVKGYAAYKVANTVDTHYAVGMGSYDVLINTNGASIFVENAYEVPNKEGVLIENACIVEIANGEGPLVGFNSIINGTGPAISTGAESGKGYARQAILLYNNGTSLSMPDYYLTGGNDNPNLTVVEEVGVAPTNDEKAGDTSEPPSTTEEKTTEPAANATGPYAEWKNGAITAPAIGQLVAAGTFDIEFKRLYGATQYEVYVDDELIETISGTDAEAATFTVKHYSVDVNKHEVKVVATMPQGSRITSNIRSFFISKKGMGIWQDDAHIIEETNLSWYYTWSTSELTGVSDEVEFVPMIWGDFGDSSAEYWWLKNGAYKDYNYLLSYNEPDRDDQSNMTPQRAVDLWPTIALAQNDGVKVSSPATSSPHVLFTDTSNEYGVVGAWYGAYENAMYETEYHDDYTAIHFYFDYPAEDFVLETIKQVYEDTGKPIWITEWGVAQWSQIQSFDWLGGGESWQRDLITDFMYSILPKIDQIDYVERYAWFPFDGSSTDKFGNGAGGLFYDGADDPYNGQLTSVGEAYATLGNAGYDADARVQDKVVDDGEVEEPPVEETTTDEYYGYTECTYNESTSLGAWQYYIGQNWSYATAMYKGGTTLDDFSLKITGNYGLQDWGISTITEPIEVTPGVEYTITIKMDSDVTTTETIGFKENLHNFDFGATTLVEGENVFTGTFTPALETVQFTFDMGRLPTGTTTTITSFELVANEEPSSEEETSVEETSEEETSEEPTTEEPTTEEVALPSPTGLVWAGTEEMPHYFVWQAVEGAVSYNVYVNDELVANSVDVAYNLDNSLFENAGDYIIGVTTVSESGLESEMATMVYTVEEEITTTEETTVPETTTEEETTVPKTEVVALEAIEDLVLYNYRQSGEGYKVVFEDPNSVTPLDGETYYYEVYVDNGGYKLIGTVNGSEEFIGTETIDALGLTEGNNYTIYIRSVLEKADSIEVSEYGSGNMNYNTSTTTTFNTGLPQIVIQTADNSVNLWTDASKAKADSTIYINDANGNTIHSDFGTANVRGNSTAGAEKKAYNFKLDSKYDVLGLGKAKKFSLLANAFDKSLLRNKLAMDLGNALGIPYNSNSTFVDVYVNGRYMGNYLLIESVEAGDNRVEIDSENDEVYNTDVLIELENNGKNEEGCTYITTSTYAQRFVMGSPEEAKDITEEFFNQKVADTTTFLNQVETAIESNDYAQISEVIDVESFVNFYIVAEYFKQQDFNFSSTRFFVQNGKLYAGPLWDFDLSSGNVSIEYYGELDQGPTDYHANKMVWYTNLLQNPTFMRMVKERFNEVLPTIKNLYEGDGNTMDTLLSQMGVSAAKNYATTEEDGAGWKIGEKDQADGYSYANSYSFSSYDESVEQLRTWLGDRTAFLAEEWVIDEDDEDLTLAEQIATSMYNMAKNKPITVYNRINEGLIENINDGLISLTETMPTFGAISPSNEGWGVAGNPVYATIDLGNYYNAAAIEQIFVQYKDNNANDTVVSRTYKVQYSTDGINFYDAVAETKVDSLDAIERYTIDDVSAVQGAVRYVRVYYPQSADYGIQISEIAVLDTDMDAAANIVEPVVVEKPSNVIATMSKDNAISVTVEGSADYTYNIIIDGEIVKTGVKSGETVEFENLAEGTYSVSAMSSKDGWYSEATTPIEVAVTSSYKWNGGQIGYTKSDFIVETLNVDGTDYYNYVTYPGLSATGSEENQPASYAIDGNVDTRWETSASDPQSITVNLGKAYNIKAISALWEFASSKDFIIEASTDGVNYEQIALAENAPGGADRYDLFTFANTVNAQYIKLTGTSRTSGYGHSIYEFGIYGPDPYEAEVVIPDPSDITISGDVKIEGYQISNIKQGNRVIGSVEPTINGQDVVNWGFIYAISEINGTSLGVEDEVMYVGSTNGYVTAMESTPIGTSGSQLGDSDTATYFVRTTIFSANNKAEFTAKYKVRAYAVLADGSYVYSDVASYSSYDVAKTLYDNKMMNTLDGHNYLYNNILTVVDSAYVAVDYQWSDTVVKPTDSQAGSGTITESDDVKVEGYQISNVQKGNRVVGSVEPTINGQEVTAWGFVYAISEVNGNSLGVTNEDMYVGSTNNYVQAMESTSIGTLNAQLGDSDTATYFVRTTIFSAGTAAEFTARYKVRAYAVLADGSYVYSKVCSYSAFDISDNLYQNKLMNTSAGHEYLYSSILSVVDSTYQTVDYQWSNSMVKK